jgi:hypothetical protein
MSTTALLGRAIRLLEDRAIVLEARIRTGDETAWPEYRETVGALATVFERMAPGRRGEFLTTREMAERLGVSPKTLLKHKARGTVRPAIQRGKLIRWHGDEPLARLNS